MALYAVIMAGGIGTRFWPYSRQSNPKQFLNVFGEDTMIQATIGRLQGLIPVERCYVVTHTRYVEKTFEQLPGLPLQNILAEPISRNTAPCIAYAAIELLKHDPDATMVVLPADHQIRNPRRFQEVLKVAVEKAQEPDALVTIGVEPTHPETGYGYIQYDMQSLEEDLDGLLACKVKAFAEKPDLATAERFLDSGDFLWNSGMFIWRADTILHQFQQFLPEVLEAFEPVSKATEPNLEQIEHAFRRSPKISIDYGIMERAQNVYVVPGAFGWNDVGDWRAVYDLSEKDSQGNTFRGQVLAEDASRNLVFAGDKMVVLIGIHDAMVVNTDDAILICAKDATQKVKNAVDYMHVHKLEDYI